MDVELREQILRATVRDLSFLKVSGRDLSVDDFPEQHEKMVAEKALWFWTEFSEPAGPLIRSHVQDSMAQLKEMGEESRQKLKAKTNKLLDSILSPEIKPISVKALQERVTSLKKHHFFEGAVDNILEAHEKGKLNADVLVDLVDRANRELADTGLEAVDVLEDAEMDHRIRRRNYQQQNIKYPLSLIHELDKKIKILAKGQVGLFLAPYSSGKGFALVHMSLSYAIQGLKVWHITLEDPKDEVEDRIDSALTGLPKARLQELPNRLKKRFRRAKAKLRGRILITDWTEEDCTIAKIERGYEVLKIRGFIPDVIVVDYDDEIKVEKEFKGESARRFEFAHMYRQMRKAAKRLDVIWWTAAQTGREGEGKKLITGRDTAEDISKIRKVALAIGIGTDPERPELKHLYVIRHRFDRSRFGVDIISDFKCSLLYDDVKTAVFRKARINGKVTHPIDKVEGNGPPKVSRAAREKAREKMAQATLAHKNGRRVLDEVEV